MAIVIRRLEEHDEVENFDCSDDALNNYLKRHAWTNQQKSSIGVSYVALDEDAPRTVLGYFTLAMASVPRDMVPMKLVVAASSQTLIGIGSAGTHAMDLCPSRVPWRRDHNGCFSTCGRSAQL